MNQTSFLKVFFPFLFSFLCGRLILQTDLLLISKMGQSATAAFGIPMRIMIIDMIVAFSLAPVISVLIASVNNLEMRKIEISRSIQITALLSLILTVLGLILYPYLLKLIVKDSEVYLLAQQSLFILTLAIPTRMIQFSATMALHAVGKGNRVIWITFSELLLNLCLDLFLVYKMNLGFKGVYIGTAICSVVSMLITLFQLRHDMNYLIFLKLDLNGLKKFLKHLSAEFGRLSSERLVAFSLLFAFTFGKQSEIRVGVFSIASECLFLGGIPSIAAMRAASIQLAPLKHLSIKESYKHLYPIMKNGFVILLGCSVLLLYFGTNAGEKLYHLTDEAMLWWKPFIFSFAILLPVKWIENLQRGVLQSKKHYSVLTKLDFGTQWFCLLPLVSIGIYLNQPSIVWRSYVITEGLSLFLLTVVIPKRLN